ncbi:MAG: DUF4175 family protein, partial [Isosphaeraceae bacterium]
MKASPSSPARSRATGLAGLLVVLSFVVSGRWAWAQAPAASKSAKAEGLFEDDKPAAKAKTTAKTAATGVSDRDTISFTQENAAAQMTELEERMFRLSEALRGLEPENASRLRLALKFSREELILEQMRDTHKMLKQARLAKAETEIRELLAKLEHLRDVLLAEDLDFQLKLARLRQMRETLSQLDRIVKDQRRELGWSRFAVEARDAKERLAARRSRLETLARDQRKVVDDTRGLAAWKSEDTVKGKADLRDRETAIGKAATALAADPVFADFQPSQLRKAEGFLAEATEELSQGGKDLTGALDSEEKAEAVFREELKRLDGRVAEAERDLAREAFARHESGQLKIRRAAESLAAASGRLGDAGVALQKSLIRAGAAMQGAEKSLARTAPAAAATDQSAALDILTKSAEDLAQAAEKLLVQLRTELQTRLITELTEMHEAQASIRETTEAQASRLAQKSRSAAITITGLSRQEGELAGRTERLLALVEETEFGIALPTALRVFSHEMRDVEGRLKATDASPRTVALEKRIEEDLLGLLQAIRRLPPTTPPRPGSPLPSNLLDRERELNRLIAELKTIRLLQSRLNDDTTSVDKSRPGPTTLP